MRCKFDNSIGKAAAMITAAMLLATAGTPSEVHGQQSGYGSDFRQRGDAIGTQSWWQGNSWLNGIQNAAREWHLGIDGRNTAAGVTVFSVNPGSAAGRAGIQQGDTIVNVNGFQVGLVNGRLYDLSEELARRADQYGRVELLVQSARSLRLNSMSLQLDRRSESLQGELVYSGPSLPSNALVTVELRNVSRPYYEVRNGRSVFRVNTTRDIPFQIAYDPSYINPQDVYEVRATVTLGGRTIMDSVRPQRVITLGNPSTVRLQLQEVGGYGGGGLVSAAVGSEVTAGYGSFGAFDDQVVQLYRRYLNRQPTYLELAAIRSTPGIADRLEALALELMAAQEYFDAAGNNNNVWLDAVFREIVKRPPTQRELAEWMRRFESLRYSRTELLRQLHAQVS